MPSPGATATVQPQAPPRNSGWYLMWKILTFYWGILIVLAGACCIAGALAVPQARAGLLVAGLVCIPTGVLVAATWFLVRRMPAPPTMGEATQRIQHGADVMETFAGTPERARIRNQGYTGKGTITDILDTGRRRGVNPLIQLEIDVALEGQPQYHMQFMDSIAPIILGGIKQGRVFTIHVDRADRTKVVIDY
jgi:hypothetical protein